MPLHIDYRPKTLKEMEGNLSTIESLSAVLSRKSDIPHAFLFVGPSGCGKTTLGRIVAKELGCTDLDLREIDVADFRGIDTIREIRNQARLKPLAGSVRVWLLDEAQKMTGDAQSALLKILEEPPAHVYFIICTTDPEKLLKTIRSRCMIFSVGPLGERQMTRLLKRIVTQEEVEEFPEEAYGLIHRASLGHVRAALVILDKIIDLPTESIIKSIQSAGKEEAQVIDLCRLLLKRASWKEIAKALSNLPDGAEPESVRHAVLGYMNSVLMKEQNAQAFIVADNFENNFYNSGKTGLTLACFRSTVLED